MLNSSIFDLPFSKILINELDEALIVHFMWFFTYYFIKFINNLNYERQRNF
jgi:uncharacterized membrane protein (UPF0182 family)